MQFFDTLKSITGEIQSMFVVIVTTCANQGVGAFMYLVYLSSFYVSQNLHHAGILCINVNVVYLLANYLQYAALCLVLGWGRCEIVAFLLSMNELTGAVSILGKYDFGNSIHIVTKLVAAV